MSTQYEKALRRAIGVWHVVIHQGGIVKDAGDKYPINPATQSWTGAQLFSTFEVILIGTQVYPQLRDSQRSIDQNLAEIYTR
jgi:hypothetical protein